MPYRNQGDGTFVKVIDSPLVAEGTWLGPAGRTSTTMATWTCSSRAVIWVGTPASRRPGFTETMATAPLPRFGEPAG